MITEPAAVQASSPIVTGAMNALSTPVLTLRPIVVREGLELDLAQFHVQLQGDLLGELGMRAAREDHQPLLRRQRNGVAGTHLDQRDRRLESRQRLLNRPAFHPAPPC